MNTIIAKTNKLISILLLVIILSLSFLTTLTYAVEDLNSDKYSTVQGTNSTTKVTKYDNEKNTNINELTKNDDDESQKDNSDNQSTNLKEIEDSNKILIAPNNQIQLLSSENTDTKKEIYVVWNSDTSTISLTYNTPDDSTIYDTFSNLKNFIHKYRYSVTTIDFSLFDENGNKVTIIMPEDCSYMFDCCFYLKQIVAIENLNTSNVTNMTRMFFSCKSLTQLDVSNFDTSNVTNMRYMFDDCESLTQLDVSNFDTSNVTDMTCMFAGCESLTQLDISNFDTSNVTNMISMFFGCANLSQLDVSNFDTSNVTNMDFMFSQCANLSQLDLSSFDTSNVTNMRYMFDDCESLTQLDVSNFDTSNVTNMSSMFSDCESLTQLDVSNFDTSNVTNMSSMFSDCKSLTQLDVSTLDTSNVTNMRYMFADCESLTQLDVSNFDTSNVTDITCMFSQCANLTQLDVSNFDTSNVTSLAGMFALCKNLTTLDLSNFDTFNVIDMSSMFYDCTSLTKLDISNFNTPKVWNNTNQIFFNTNNLNTIILSQNISQEILSSLSQNWYKLPDGTFYNSLFNSFDKSTIAGTYVKDFYAGIYAMWKEDTKTISIVSNEDAKKLEGNDYCRISDLKSFIKKYNTKVKIINLAFDEKIELDDVKSLFENCTSLISLQNIDNLNITSTDMSNMFKNCSSLTSIELPKWNINNVETMHSMFENCTNLTELKNINNLVFANIQDMSNMFKNCSSLISIDLSKVHTGSVKNMSSLFENCTSLKNLKLTEFDYDLYIYMWIFSTGNVTNMSNMFKNCSSLENLNIGGFYTDKLEENGMKDAFSGLTSLNKIVLGYGIEKLDTNCGLSGDTWFRTETNVTYTANELIKEYNPEMYGTYLNGVLKKHYYASTNSNLDNLYEIHNPDKPFTGYCINLHRLGYASYSDRFDATDSNVLETLLNSEAEGGVHGYSPLGNNMKEALLTLMYYGYPQNAAGIMNKYNLTEERYSLITQNAIWDFTDRYGNPSGPTMFTGDELSAYNELVSQKYSNIENADRLLFYVYKSWDKTQQNLISMTSIADDIYGGVEVTKVDTNGNPLSGAEFTITNKDTGETKIITSNSDGIASICRTDKQEGLKSGYYEVRETKAPIGYSLTNDYYEFAITEANKIVSIGYKNGEPDENFITFTDDEDKSVVGGGLKITKKTDKEISLANVEFSIYSDSACTNRISTLKTDTNGIAKSGKKDFKPGKYYIKESKSPYGYKLNTNIFKVTIEENKFTEIEILNEAKKGTINIIAHKNLNGANIKDYVFTFELIDDKGNIIQSKNNDSNGTITFDPIEYYISDGTYKNYTIREVSGNLEDITYDKHEELVTILIKDTGEEYLTCTPVYDKDGAIFTNTYTNNNKENASKKTDDSENQKDIDNSINNNNKESTESKDNNYSVETNKISEDKNIKTGDTITFIICLLSISIIGLFFIKEKKK